MFTSFPYNSIFVKNLIISEIYLREILGNLLFEMLVNMFYVRNAKRLTIPCHYINFVC